VVMVMGTRREKKRTKQSERDERGRRRREKFDASESRSRDRAKLLRVGLVRLIEPLRTKQKRERKKQVS